MLNSHSYSDAHRGASGSLLPSASRPAAARPTEIPKSELLDIRAFFIARRRRRNLIRSSVAVAGGLLLTAAALVRFLGVL